MTTHQMADRPAQASSAPWWVSIFNPVARPLLKLGAPLLATFADRLPLVRLPSSSPANARLPFADKLAEWRRLLGAVPLL